MDKDIEMEKNFCVVAHCSCGSLEEHTAWEMYYGPYTEEMATQMLAELLASHSPMTIATVKGFSMKKLEPKTVAEIMDEVQMTNKECI